MMMFSPGILITLTVTLPTPKEDRPLFEASRQPQNHSEEDRPLFEASRQPQNHSEEDRKPKLAAAAPQLGIVYCTPTLSRETLG